jgi:hypothetical protein
MLRETLDLVGLADKGFSSGERQRLRIAQSTLVRLGALGVLKARADSSIITNKTDRKR